ncbi:hypothetical protein [Bacillus ndiopicus]|uniref:hypothetical protein n=1 Tax=Bacillus ndiopicus TaxID=1347368 RepID=UPI0005A90E5B|nr:hypothetical protein [Bacillus ndiopicus]
MDILNVVLKTNKLNEMKYFYKEKLGFLLEAETANSFKINFGMSSIEFNNIDVEGNPYYHFACDIPSNQFKEAKEWIKKRTNLLTEDGEDEIDFTHLSAKSLYFEDPSGNIVEFIARLKDNPSSNQPFSLNSIQKLSEMSLVVKNKISVAERLRDFQIVERDDSEITQDTLSFMGDKKTKVFLLLVRPERRWLFSSKESVIFPINISLDSGIQLGVNDENEFYIEASN